MEHSRRAPASRPGWGRWALAALLTGACGEPPEVERRTLDFTLAGVPYAIDVPSGAAVTAAGRDEVRIELRPGTRASDAIVLGPAVPADPSLPRETVLDGVGVARYATAHLAGGSGGEEVALRGVIELPTGRLRLSCHRQGDDPGPADWCLAPLATLRSLE